MPEFNWVDLVLVILIISSAVNGLIQGAAVQVFTYAGFGIGLLLGARLGPVAAQFVESPLLRIPLVMLILFGTAAILAGVGKFIGAKATWAVPRASPLGMVNAAGGLVVAVIATLLAIWLIGGMLAQVGIAEVSSAFQQSRVMRSVTEPLPPAPAVFSRIQRTLLPTGFPIVFTELEPSPAPPVEIEGRPDLTQMVNSVRPSVLRVTATGCGRVTTGSGFVAAPGLVITNAHVVAGVDQPTVTDPNGTHRTTVVLFDPQMDLAILRTTGLAGSPLPLVQENVTRGVLGGVLGYPGGGPFTVEEAVIRDRFQDALGRDIYSRGQVNRNVYQIDAAVRSGNSGGPFVDPEGRVVGVIFASSLVNPQIAYALTSADVAVQLDRAGAVTGAVSAGPCIR